MRSYVFVFVPIFVEVRERIIQTDLVAVSSIRQSAIAMNTLPFWAWFIDNPRRQNQAKEK
jgi:hypothetical protein